MFLKHSEDFSFLALSKRLCIYKPEDYVVLIHSEDFGILTVSVYKYCRKVYILQIILIHSDLAVSK